MFSDSFKFVGRLACECDGQVINGLSWCNVMQKDKNILLFRGTKTVYSGDQERQY